MVLWGLLHSFNLDSFWGNITLVRLELVLKELQGTREYHAVCIFLTRLHILST